MESPSDEQVRADTDLVSYVYHQCALRSKDFDKWVEGGLHPIARRLYIVVAATDNIFQNGILFLVVEEERFELLETADAFESFGFTTLAQAIRDLNKRIGQPHLSTNRHERLRQVDGMNFSVVDHHQLNDVFFSHGEDAIYRVLAKVIRQHPEAFPPAMLPR